MGPVRLSQRSESTTPCSMVKADPSPRHGRPRSAGDEPARRQSSAGLLLGRVTHSALAEPQPLLGDLGGRALTGVEPGAARLERDVLAEQRDASLDPLLVPALFLGDLRLATPCGERACHELEILVRDGRAGCHGARVPRAPNPREKDRLLQFDNVIK